jgi:hypothetical protein
MKYRQEVVIEKLSALYEGLANRNQTTAMGRADG